MKYKKRTAEPLVLRLLKAFPVLGITGPRQSGKSTMLQHLLNEYTYVTFDDDRNIQFFEEDPVGFLKKYQNKVIFDEVQLVPKIFSAIKVAVDQDRQNYGKFVLTGSSQFAFLKSASESLAGRIGLLSLLPFQMEEMPKALIEDSIFQGSYPELVLNSYEESEFWYNSYIDTYLNKDVRALSNIGDMREFRRFVQLLAGNIGQTLDQTFYAKKIGVSVPTIKRWLSILEASYIVFLVPPYFENFGKRLVKSPKVYFYDTGLVSFLTGIKTFEQYDQGPLAGALFENYVISEIYKKELHQGTQGELFFFRTQDRLEVDLILDHKSSREWIEIKRSSTLKPAMLRPLNTLKGKDKALLIYQGENDQYKEIDVYHYQNYLNLH